jgi:hypothetical protein
MHWWRRMHVTRAAWRQASGSRWSAWQQHCGGVHILGDCWRSMALGMEWWLHTQLEAPPTR